MTREEITRIAREAGFVGFDGDNKSLRRFADLVRADEREQCAKMVEGLFDDPNDFVLEFMVDAIRAGGNT